MDNNEIYVKLFDIIKKHEWDNFITTLNSFDEIDVNIRDENNNHLITYAVLFNRPDIVQTLIDKGAKIDIQDVDERSLLYIPIKYDYYDILTLLLKTNKENIGISIIDIKDKYYKIPIHYAINLKNIRAIKLLLEYGSNPNIPDINGYNSLHHAIYSRNPEICKLIIKYISDINSRCNTGETSLHMACNLQLLNIVQILIDNKIDLDIQDFDHEFTSLHYAVTLNNRDITKLLLNSGANPNIQDVFGNTPIHYAINENSSESITILLTSKSTKSSINLNLWNIDGKIPLHIMLDHDYETIDENIFDIMIDKSNLSIQDNDGNTCLHFLINLGIWKDYLNILKNKKLDILAQNKAGIRPIDLVKNRDYETLINLTVESYLRRLKNANTEWSSEWEIMCSREFNEEDKKELEQYFNENINDNNNLQMICSKTIKNKILKILDDIKDGKRLLCADRTYPLQKNKMCINLNTDKDISVCTFTGSTLDVLIGLIYLLKKHKSTCSTLESDFAENKELCRFYRSLGIIMNTRCEFLNFEIVWVHQKLYLIEGFYDRIKKCIDNNKRFIIIPVGIELRAGSHANYLIYDVKENIVERFEPHGATVPPGLNYNPNLLDEILENRFKAINTNITYMRPSEFLPKVGFQLMDVYETKRKKIGDPGGFCALWSIWYIDMRLTYSNIKNTDLVKMLIKTIKLQNISVKNMIRNYARNIIDMRDIILKKANMDVNDWLNDQYVDSQVDKVLIELKNEINSI